MNRVKLMSLILAALTCAGSLLACSDAGNGGESGAGTSASTTPETNAVTAIPRYDYLEAEVAKDVVIDAADYTDVTLTISDSLKVDDKAVADRIAYYLFEKREALNGTTQVKDQALSLGDDAFIYYKGFLDGEAFDGGSNWDAETPHQLGIGSAAFIPGFEDGLVGVVPQDTSKENPYKLHVTFPEDYDEKLAGKDVVFDVVIMYSVQYKVPDYTWANVRDVLKYELEKGDETLYSSDRAKLDEYEEYVRSMLVESMATSIENAKIDALWTYLIEKATCKNLPKQEVEYYYNAYYSELEYSYEYYSMYGGEEFQKTYPDIGKFAVYYMGLDASGDWKAELTEMAEKMVQKDMIGHAIGENEGIESVTEEEYREQVKYWTTYYEGYMTEAEIIESMGETFLRESAYSDKIRDWLMDRITFTYKDGTPVDEEDEKPAESTPADAETTASAEDDAANG